MLKHYLFGTLFIVTFVEYVCGDKYFEFKLLDTIQDEAPCLKNGGRCVIVQDCPKERQVSTSGLCPTQQRRGVECCYGISVKETRCTKLGGICRSTSVRCPATHLLAKATDCPGDMKCCALTI